MKHAKIIIGVAILATAFLANCSATGTNQTESPAADSNENVGVAINALFSSDQSQSQSALNLEERDACVDSGGPTGIAVSTTVATGHYGVSSDGYDVASATTCSSELPLKTWEITSAVEMDCEDGNVTFAVGSRGVFIDDLQGNNTNIYGVFIIDGINFYCDVVIEHPNGEEVFTASCEQEQSDGSRSVVEQATAGNSCQSPE